jgi:cell wall-associated NlpC family hydrolase
MWLVLILSCGAAPPPEAPPIAAAEIARPKIVAPSPSPTAEAAIVAARTWLGTEYKWEGRGTDDHPGMDCLGLLFRAYGDTTGTSWKKYPVDPSPLVKSGLLGKPVAGLDGVLRKDLDPAALVKGDVLYFLMANKRIEDEPLWHHDGFPYWPWHTGLYAGEGRVLQADPWDTVQESDLYEVQWDALFVTRVAP